MFHSMSMADHLFFTFEIWTIFYAWSDDRAGHFEVTSSVVRPGVENGPYFKCKKQVICHTHTVEHGSMSTSIAVCEKKCAYLKRGEKHDKAHHHHLVASRDRRDDCGWASGPLH